MRPPKTNVIARKMHSDEEDFRKSFKENNRNQKSCSPVVKAGGKKWKSMTDAEKAPYAEKALKRKREGEKVIQEYTDFLLAQDGYGCNELPE